MSRITLLAPGSLRKGGEEGSGVGDGREMER